MSLRAKLKSYEGKVLMSILLGLGLATLFRKVCTERNCIDFNGPIISDFEDKTYGQNDKCYKYKLKVDKCDPKKRIVQLEKPVDV